MSFFPDSPPAQVGQNSNLELNGAPPLNPECSPFAAANCLVTSQLTDVKSSQPKTPDGAQPAVSGSDETGESRVTSAKNELLKAADARIGSPAATREFRENIELFQQRAKQNGLALNSVSATLQNLKKMLESAKGAPITAAERNTLVEQMAGHLANPQDGVIKQGKYETCPWALAEIRDLSNSPDRVTGLLADMVSTGKVEVGNNRTVEIDPQSMQPDGDARVASLHDSSNLKRRDYASQLTQLMFNNIRWSYYKADEYGRTVPDPEGSKDDIQYIEQGGKLGTGDSGERLRMTMLGYRVTDEDYDKKGIYAGGATIDELQGTDALITGHNEHPWLIARKGSFTSKTGIFVDSPEELANSLTSMKKEGAFPAGISLYIVEPPLRDEWLSRHPDEKTPPKAGHFVAITDVSQGPNGEPILTMVNPWGRVDKITPEQLFACMKKPESDKPE